MNLNDMIARNIAKLQTKYLENAEHLEACLGRDHA